MGKGQVLAVLVVVGLVVAVMVVAWAEGGKKEGKASLDRVPAAVKETILKEAKGNSVKEIDQKTENGKTAYEAEWTMVVKATVDAEGTLLRRAVGREGGDGGGACPRQGGPAEGGQGRGGPGGQTQDARRHGDLRG